MGTNYTNDLHKYFHRFHTSLHTAHWTNTSTAIQLTYSFTETNEKKTFKSNRMPAELENYGPELPLVTIYSHARV